MALFKIPGRNLLAEFKAFAFKGNMTSGSPGPMSTVLNDLQAQIDAGNIGVTANAGDVDSIAKDGGAFGYDASLATGLNFGYRAGRVLVGQAVKSVAQGSILLAASSTVYVEFNPAGGGSVVSNTVGWTTGFCPLYLVTTGVSGIATVTNAKVLLICHGSTVVTGQMLSTAGSTKRLRVVVGTLSATGDAPVIVCPNHAATLVGAWLTVTTTVAADDTNYWTATLVNKGAAGTATTAMLAATNPNTTKVTGGSGLTAYVPRPLTLTGTSANLNTAALDPLVLTLTKAAAAANLVNLVVDLDLQFSN